MCREALDRQTEQRAARRRRYSIRATAPSAGPRIHGPLQRERLLASYFDVFPDGRARQSWPDLAVPDKFFLWRELEDPLADVPPDFEADPSPLLLPYAGNSGRNLSALNERSLELVVASWLDPLVSGYDRRETSPTADWLTSSGLLDAIRGGRSEVQAVV